MSDIIRLKPQFYIHVLNNNTNVTSIVTGPCVFTRKEEETVVFGPEPFISIPPRHYCRISNPVVRDADGNVVKDSNGQIMLKFGDEEIRFEQPEPFELFPGEKLNGAIQPLLVVSENTALRLKALRDLPDQKLKAGDEWLFKGPATYLPDVAVQMKEKVVATVIKPNSALRLRARYDCKDSTGRDRRAGEEWLVRNSGAYLPGVDEIVVRTVDAFVLTEKKALHLRAIRSFSDVYGKERKAGQEWLVTHKNTEAHIPDVFEQVVGEVSVISLNNRQYCVIIDPFDKTTNQTSMGKRELRMGEISFFLLPGERLENGIESVKVLAENEALLLKARESYTDAKKQLHVPGDLWMVYGPCDYVPPVEVEIVETRRAITLDDVEGIYVRDIKTGKVRSVIGQTYMLKPNEVLWEKDLSPVVEALLQSNVVSMNAEVAAQGIKGKSSRDKTRVVTYRAPHNSLVQVYDYKNKVARVVFGPDLVMLKPDEEFTVLSLSGGKPKRPNYLKTLALCFGPDFMTDIINVETSDHARLQLQLSYSWSFRMDAGDGSQGHLESQASKVFQVPDFVGDSCKSLASRVRAAVAATPFDVFHKKSADIIHKAVFGTNEDGSLKNEFVNLSNNLVISSIDIQSVEPVDQRTRDSLQKSVQLAIEITIQSQEAAARHEAERSTQSAKGALERARIKDDAVAEEARMDLLKLQAQSATVEAIGQAAADAVARAKAAQIEGEASVKASELRAEAKKIEGDSDLAQVKARNEAEVSHQKALNEIETFRMKALADIEADKFKDTVSAIGADTIEAIARAGPEMQVKLLQGLGLQGYMVVDSNSPVNLFSTANAMVNSGVTSGVKM
eukprot:c19422_g1_i1.p1 GENE.c19422_g1_i1~~c19422_g1_i1.p1  ORF type:complete len:862 (+),score=32.95 c19422_g1_i1:52-2586(+)